MQVAPKKSFGQHFLKDDAIAFAIADSFGEEEFDTVVEVGPGKGILTKHLFTKYGNKLSAVEVDEDSISYLQTNYPALAERIIYNDFLQIDLSIFNSTKIAVIGNYPYNISTQIIFKVLDYKDLVASCAGMFQLEVAKRICAVPGNKDYGILSVLAQAWYNCKLTMTVHEHVFEPPPKVKSGVILMERNSVTKLNCNEAQFKTVVKAAFNQRRKTLNNALKSINVNHKKIPYAGLRAETLSVSQFEELTNELYSK
ncbi:MAG: ribosomal RNA small subunit methyltransferase A [Bacteroidetes bacterium]|nr:ribosomal RNA small subunit methyltransferase A [Bacteroidota bacterium]